MSEQVSKPTAQHMKVGAGILVLFALAFIAFGLGQMFGAGVGWVIIGVLVFVWAASIRKAIKNGEYDK